MLSWMRKSHSSAQLTIPKAAKKPESLLRGISLISMDGLRGDPTSLSKCNHHSVDSPPVHVMGVSRQQQWQAGSAATEHMAGGGGQRAAAYHGSPPAAVQQPEHGMGG